MKIRFFLALIVIMTTMFRMNAQAQSSKDPKVLVAYFSWSGNTRAIAEQIKELTGSSLVEIQVSNPYPTDYNECTVVAKKEKETNARPPLKTQIDNMETYDIIFIGFPNWWGTMPMPVVTFLESYDFSDKTVIPFCTHGGGGEQKCFKDFVKLTGKSQHKEGFLISGSRADSAHQQIEKWLHKIGIME